jgi:oligopeptide transport system substrate-binding protein
LEGPTGYFLHLLAVTATYPVPQHIVEAHGSAWTDVTNIVTNGPFKLEAWQPGEMLSLSRNPHYHGRFTGNMQRVELTLNVKSQALLEMYEIDRLDACGLAPRELDRARQRHPGEYVSWPRATTACIGFDISRPPFDDIRVRQAFVHAIDREALVEVILRGYFSPATGGFVPPGMPGHSPGIGLAYDVDRARWLLAEVGYPNGRGLPAMSALTIDGESGIDEYLQTQWRENLGVNIQWEAIKLGQYHSRLQEALPHMSHMGWVADYPDPDDFLRVCLEVYYPKPWNEAYAQLVGAARRVTDQDERMKMYRQADKILVEEAVIMPLIYGTIIGLVKPWVSRFALSAFKGWHFKDVVIEPH